ncbi:MAG TPA: YkgJ family cysteine cluster protein [Candidatus Sulfotelmatobacter sp.]|nr:YkgJ family cysteine cluster protein [Candidatus Sulfotelmatobacter sp.]
MVQVSPAEDLCLACGMCCNGVIFADVRLQPGDNAVRLKVLGLPLVNSRSTRQGGAEALAHTMAAVPRYPKLCQPCAAVAVGRCRIYAERPKYCREFECVLLKRVKAGHTQPAAALRVIRSAQRRAEKVRRLLRTLGDTDENLALIERFRRTTQRLEEIGMDRASADTYGQLTLAVHDLNYLLSEEFYPGNSASGY